jgi:hypothetical protein
MTTEAAPTESLRETLSRVATTEVPTGTVDTPLVEDKPAVAEAAPVVDDKPAPVVDDKPAPVVDEKAAPVVEDKPKVDEKPAAKPEHKGGIRPPESWKPAIRDAHWATLPVAVQAEIHRRERQIDEVLQHSAEARKGMDQLNGLVTNFKDVFDYEKAPPLQSIGNLLQISRTLRFGPAPQKAQVMAQVIQGFGVDVKLLDQALSMLVAPNDPAAAAMRSQTQNIEQIIERQLAPVRQMFGNLQSRQQQAKAEQDAAMQSEIEVFANDPKNEYFEVVRDTMADLLELSASRGQKLNLQDAYQRAILAHNDLAGPFAQQRLAEAAQNLNAPAAKAQQLAGLSVTGAPSPAAPASSGASLRADLEAAVAKHSGRQ